MDDATEMLLDLLEAAEAVLSAEVKDQWRVLTPEAAERFYRLQEAAGRARRALAGH